MLERGNWSFMNRSASWMCRAERACHKDAVFNLASMTKPLVAVGALTLVEDGRLLLNTPVSAYLPELDKLNVAVITRDATDNERVETEPLKRKPTVNDLLRHTEGMESGRSARSRGPRNPAAG
jgi:CubicO group peptidase (beta-lactamase class C family)